MGGKAILDLGFLTKGLTVSASGKFRLRNHRLTARQISVTMYDWGGESKFGIPDYSLGTGLISIVPKPADSWVKNTHEDVMYQLYEGLLNYNRTFQKHGVSFMAGMTAERTDYQKLYGYRKNMAVDELDDINTGDATTQEASGGSNQVGLVSFIGSLKYDYSGIYLVDFLFRRDGSSKFAPEHRWSNFGGVSAAVRISEYDFIKKLNLFSNLKLRASYGETGSQTGIGNYDYISGIGTGTTVMGFEGGKVNTAWISGISSRDRSWEQVKTTNFALDFGVLNGRLSGTFEYFLRKNDGMLISMTYPQSFGGSAPKTNSGNFKANGWELLLNWRDKIGEKFQYNVDFSFK